jgi:hypothetical protein
MMPANPETIVIEVRLDGEAIATGTCPSEIRDLSRSVGMPLVPAMLRKIADKLEAAQ